MSDDKHAILARRRHFLVVALAGVGCGAPPPAIPSAPRETAKQESPAREPESESGPKPVDTDGDGVPDERDRCPDVDGNSTSEDELGCPPRPCLMIVAPSEIQILQVVLFAHGMAKLSKSSLRILEEIVKLMQGHPELVLEIQGHTQAGEPYRTALERANGVRAHLVQNGIAEDRMTTVSYGDTRPVDRDPAKNRRVSFAAREK